MTVYQQRLPRDPAAWPHQIGVIPPRALSFQQRAEADQLRASLRRGDEGALTQVLTGMGGVGKTQIAADYAHTAWQDGTVDVLVWITAATRAAVLAGYANAGLELGRADPDDPERAAATFLAWLEPKAGEVTCRWLLVLDDVADPNDLRGLWPPTSPTGKTLVTTRSRDAALVGSGRRLVGVSLFTSTEAVTYLAQALDAHNRTDHEAELAALAHDLGYLPLALSQAVAYLADANVSTAEYRALLADQRVVFADAAPSMLPDDQNHTTAAALTLSLNHADTLRPQGLARPMLQLAAFLDPNGIPHTVLTSAPALTYLADHRTPPAGPRTGSGSVQLTESEAAAALQVLHRLHLIELKPGTPLQAIRVHQLTQRAVRDALNSDLRHNSARSVADALTAVWPHIERDTNLAQTLRANATALTVCAEDDLYQPVVHKLLYRVGQSLGESGQDASARDHFQHVAAAALRRLGPDHPDTLANRYNLTRWRGEAGDAAGAVAAFAELLNDMVRVLGPDHPDTFATRHAMVGWRWEAGDLGGSVNDLADLLDDQIRVLGPDHLDTLRTRHSLAAWEGHAGNEAGAAAAFAELLADTVRVLGPDHPSTLLTRHNLAYWKGRAGDADGAAVAFAEMLIDMVRVLGPDHPETLTTRGNQARWLWKAGFPAEAIQIGAEVLMDHVRVLGEDHVATTRFREQLARWRANLEAGAQPGAR